MTNAEARQVLQEVWRNERTDYQSVEFREALDRAIRTLGLDKQVRSEEEKGDITNEQAISTLYEMINLRQPCENCEREHCIADCMEYHALDIAIRELGKEDYQMTDKIRKAIKEEFKYRASQGRTQYSMEEVIYIVNEVIDEVEFEENRKV